MRKLLLIMTILSFCMSTVSAIQISTPTLSGERNADISTTLTITNDGSTIVSGLRVTSTADSKYSIRFENVPSSIGPGSSAIVTVKGFIPKDFDGKKSIGSITVTTGSSTSTNPFTTHNFTPSNQTPTSIILPVAMSAANDCGANTPDPGTPIIGQWHSGTCDSATDIEVNQPSQATVDAGWARIHTNNLNDYWVSTVAADCNGQAQVPPKNWLFGGKIHTSPGLCDGNIELPSADSGWIGFYSKPNISSQLILVIANDRCFNTSQVVPTGGVVLGKVKTGPGKCDGVAEAISYNNVSLDSGSMYVAWLPIVSTPSNYLPTGMFESLNSSGLSGWAYDADAPSISVDVYVDNNFWKTLMANINRTDLVTSNKTPDANHGFSYSFTSADLAALNMSKNHTFSVYAINSPQGDNPLLNGSPKVLAALVSATNTTTTTNTTSTTSATSSATTTLYMEAKNNLEIDRVKITCDTTTKTVNEGSTIDKVSVDQTCQLTVKVKNTFADTDIEDIEIEADPANSDVDGDTADISSLDGGDSEEKTLELVVDEDADDGKVKVDINVKGTDENGGKHSDKFTFSLDIERLKHDLQISKIVVSPTQANACVVSRVDVTVFVENKGQRDEDQAAVELSVPALDFVKKITDISIDENEEESVAFSIPISASTSGTFRATAKSFFDTNGESQSKTANIVVVKCETKTPPPTSTNNQQTTNNQQFAPSNQNNVVVVPPPRVEDDVVVVPPPRAETETNETSSFGSVLFTGSLVIANLLALTVLGVMGYGYFKKKPETVEEQSETVEEMGLKDYY